VISQEEAERIYLLWYPLALTDEALAQEQREEEEALGLKSNDHDEETSDNEERPWIRRR
jgi:hypothetical protein